MYFPEDVKEMAISDISEIIKFVNSRNPGFDAELVNMDYVSEWTEQQPYRSAMTCYCDATIEYGHDPRYRISPFTLEYFVGDDDVFSAGDADEWGYDLEAKMRNHDDSEVVEASTDLGSKTPINAAADEFDDISDEELSVDDALDDMADDIDDMKDTLDDVQEDDVDIEVDNNIAGHYIAECDRCHGIFISAVIESEEPIEKISGICPLCNKDTEQYLRWVVHEVE